MTVNHIPRTGREDEDARWPSPADPGDLSKRVVRRRAELHLSQAQVAARAGLSLRYLEYLERYPARPAPAELRQLAAKVLSTFGIQPSAADPSTFRGPGSAQRFGESWPTGAGGKPTASERSSE